MNCTHGAHIMVCRTTLRVIICAMSCALEAHMFVFRRTSKHNQPPHMGLSSAAPCQAAWPFSVTLRRSSVHRKAKSWAKRRCAQETTPPPSASRTHERTSNPLFRQKNIFLFLRTALAHLPAPVDYVRPTQTHKPTRPSNKPKIDPTPGNPQTNDVTKPRPHMTPRSRSICARRPVFFFFLWPFSHKITFLFLGTELARLPVLVGFFQPIHTHALSQLQNKVGIKPTPGNPPEHDVTKLHLHMTPHPFLHTRV